MENQFADYETSKKLKKLGFEEDCLSYYLTKKNPLYGKAGTVLFHAISGMVLDSNTHDLRCSRPTWHQVKQWLYDKYKISFLLEQDKHKAFGDFVFICNPTRNSKPISGISQASNCPVIAEVQGIKAVIKYHLKKKS